MYVVTDLYPVHLQARKVSDRDYYTFKFSDRERKAEHLDDGVCLVTRGGTVSFGVPSGPSKASTPLYVDCPSAHHPHYSWRWAYGIGSLFNAIVVLLIAFFMDETFVTLT